MIDFFSQQHTVENVRDEALFGINDAVEDGSKGLFAYTTTTGTPESWNAVVRNDKRKRLQFVAVDHNIVVKDNKGDERSLCDGMLYDNDGQRYIAFIELKVRAKDWIQYAEGQLRSTIDLYKQSDNHMLFVVREAYAANRRHPSFNHSHRTMCEKFKAETGFRLLITNTLNVK